MSKTGVSLMLVLFIVLANPAMAAEELSLPSPGFSAPGDALYGLEIAYEKAVIAITLDDERRVERHLAFAEERLAEARFLAALGEANALSDEQTQEFIAEASMHYSAAVTKASDEAQELGREDVIALVQESTQKHVAALEAVLERVPSQAHDAIQQAIEASKKHEKALETTQERASKRTPSQTGRGR